jgi:spore germination protein YaaH
MNADHSGAVSHSTLGGAMDRRRRNGLAIIAVVIFVAALAALGAIGTDVGLKDASTTTTSISSVPVIVNPYAAEEARNVLAAQKDVNAQLPTTEGAPAPSLPSRQYRVPLAAHQVVGFVPYYELTNIGSEDLAPFTDLVYYDLAATKSGTLVEAGPSSGGWTALQNGGAAALVSTGHAEGDRVLLSVFSESQSVLGPLSANASVTGPRLAGELATLLARYGFDGVDLDLEGGAASDRAGFVKFVAAFSSRLTAIDGSGTIMLNTYPQSAEDPTGFLDVQALAPYVDQLFVMAYDMERDSQIPSANAPLTGADLSDASALATYDHAGLGPKTILGVPFYGYDFPAAGPKPGTAATAQPYAVTYDQVAVSEADDGHKPLWDPVTDTAYTVFRLVRQWHQTWYDDPVSIALKTALAAQFKVAGVGAWEIGMVATQPEMISALAGGSRVVKLPLARQP